MLYKLKIFLLPVVMLVLATGASILPWLLPRSHQRQLNEQKQREVREEDARVHKASLAIVRSIPTNDKPCNLEEVFLTLEKENRFLS